MAKIANSTTAPGALPAQIVRDGAGSTFSVREGEGHPQAWIGIPVKRSGGAWVPKGKPRQMLVRKAGCTIVAGA